jgi:hypothetical protein
VVDPVLASGLYRLLARSMRSYADAQAGHVFREFVDMSATSSSHSIAARRAGILRRIPLRRNPG